MGFGFLDWVLFLSIFCLRPLPLASQILPNTDGYYVYEFLKNMGLGQDSVQDFNFSAPFCSWKGVFCDSRQENIVKFVASDSDLSGSIPETTIGKLSKLQHLDLSSNKITGLSSDFWSLISLKSLNLSNNRISGSLPSNIGNFVSIEAIDLSFNDFDGQIPESVSSLVSLQVLKLNHNGFGSSLPSGLMNCHSLVTVDLSSNRFNGSLPDRFASAFPKLETLNLAENELLGRDTDFTQLKSLTALNLSGNMFQGSVVGFFRDMVKVVDLSRNRFTGQTSEVHSDSGYNWSVLVFLDLSENELSGEILDSLSQAKNLRFLNLAGNRFSRQGFPRIEMISGLEYLNLSKSCLIGHIPREISQLKKLKSLDLSGNYIGGRIPIMSSKSLEILDLSWNNLTGEVPNSILRKLPWMESFNFSYNNLSLCADNSLLDERTLRSAFYGSTNTCPIAADPEIFKRHGSSRKCSGLKLTLALSLTLTLALLMVFILLAFGFKRKNRLWTVNRPGSSKEERQISKPFSFQTDSSTWVVADLKKPANVPVVMFEKPLLDITFGDLMSATSNFDRGTLLAEGKFGPVYRGFLSDGIHVALKVLVHDSTLTDHEAAREFEYLGRIKHPNLVPLTGYCLAGDQRIVIYDYMENGNLQNLLRHSLPGIQTDDQNNASPESPNVDFLMTWRFRHKVALGTARAMAFLHHGCFPSIVHRDVKSSSVYLDSNMEPRLSDFGLAKVFGTGINKEIVQGSPGYLPPEFSQPENNTSTVKSDVYCFGVVLFELITGKTPIGDDYFDSEEKEVNLVAWVRGLIRKNRASVTIDPRIRDVCPDFQIEEALKIGFLCTADHPSKRPSMHQVVGLLKDIEPVAV